MDITVSDFMKGRCNLTIYVGTNVAKLNHLAAAISSDDEALIELFKFSNNYDGPYLLLSHLAPLDQSNIIIGLESTAHYGDNLVRSFINKGFKVCTLNPTQTSFMRRNNARKAKTDKVDTFMIVKTLIMWDSLWFTALEDLDCIELKEPGKFCQKLVEQRTRLKIRLVSYMGQAFPELQCFFKSGLYQNSVYAALEEAPTSNTIASMHLTYLAHTLEVVSHDHFGKDKVRGLRVLAQKSVGVNGSSLSTQITHIIEQIELLDSQLFSTELETANLVTYLHSVIIIIPGIGIVSDGMILGGIGDIHRFSNPKKLLASAGLDPTVYQSGNFRTHRTRISERGFKALYYVLMNATHNVAKNNVTFKAYYDAKRAKDQTHYSALGHCAGKLVRVIWKILTDEVAFNLE